MKISASAPGKLMIAGEYAVLFGYPALVAAIDRWAHCHFIAGETIDLLAHLLVNEESGHGLPIFDALFRVCEEAGFSPKRGRYLLDTRSFFNFDIEQKLGLGSSAAAITAFIKVILQQYEINDRALLFRLAHQTHRLFSSGSTSGADIAAAVYEGMINYQQFDHSPRITFLHKPSWWHELIFVDTKRAQDSRVFVDRVVELQKHQPKLLEDIGIRLSQIQKGMLKAGNAKDLIALIDDHCQLLDHLGQSAHIDIVSDIHKTIYHLAHSYHGSAKPSGAGGGDFAMVFVPSPMRGRFSSDIEALGLSTSTFMLASE